MKIAVISFTRRGSRLCSFLVEKLRERGEDCAGYVQQRFFSEEIRQQKGMNPVTEGVGEWTEKQFNEMDGLIYIGAAGIAVRAIAPVLKSKLTDPAVVEWMKREALRFLFCPAMWEGPTGLPKRRRKSAMPCL